MYPFLSWNLHPFLTILLHVNVLSVFMVVSLFWYVKVSFASLTRRGGRSNVDALCFPALRLEELERALATQR